jgi:streptogramin lyase
MGFTLHRGFESRPLRPAKALLAQDLSSSPHDNDLVARASSNRVPALGRLVLPIALLLLVAAPARGSDGLSPRPAGPGEVVYRLPHDTLPGRLALAGDGSVWMTDEYRAVTRLDPSGRTKDFLARDEDFATDIVTGPDGAVWVAQGASVVRIDAAGQVKRRRVGGYGSVDAITTAGGAVWFANGGDTGAGYKPRIER